MQKTGQELEIARGAILLSLPKERVRIRSFPRWRDFVLSHLRSKVADCQKLEVSAGITEDDVSSFLSRLISAKLATMRTSEQERAMIFLIIDDFDLPLLLATEGKYIREAEQMYRSLFPLSIIEQLQQQNRNLDLRIVIAGRCIVEIPYCLISHPDVDASLVSCTHEVQFRDAFGFSHQEMRELAGRQGLSPELTQQAIEFYGHNEFGQPMQASPASVLQFITQVKARLVSHPTIFQPAVSLSETALLFRVFDLSEKDLLLFLVEILFKRLQVDLYQRLQLS